MIQNKLVDSLHNFINICQSFHCSRNAVLFKEIKQISLEKQLNWTPTRQQLVLEALASQHYHCHALNLKKICQRLEPSHLHQLIKASLIIDQKILSTNSPLMSFNHLKGLLSLEQIEAAIQTEYPSFESALKSAKELTIYAQFYLNLTQPSLVQPTINNLLNKTIWAIENTIDTLLATFGISQLERDIENDFDAQYRVQSTLALISIISSFISMAIALSGSIVIGASLAGTGIALGCIALGLYFKYLKPAPRSIQGCQNLTAQAAAGNLVNVAGREHYIDEVAKTLIASRQKPKTHPLLIGRSGVGKTEIMKGFAQAVAEGRYPELKGKQVFYVNTADLTNPNVIGGVFETPLSLEKIQKRIRHRREDVILIFDEIHQATKGDKKGNLAERLKTLLDDGQENFPYVIAATTDEEFAKYILQDNDALARRFKQIPIREMNKDQTMAILNKTILRQSGLIASQEAIEVAYNLSLKLFPERPQPYMSCRILGQAITKVKNTQNSSLQAKMIEQEASLEKILSSQLLQPGLDLITHYHHHKELEEEIAKIHTNLEQLKVLSQKENDHLKILQQLIDHFESSKDQIFKLSLEIEKKSGFSSSRINSLLKEFALTSVYVNAAWEKTIQNHMAKEGKPFVHIDLTLIQEILDSEVKMREQKEMMLAGKTSRNQKEAGIDDEQEDLLNQRRQRGVQKRQMRNLVQNIPRKRPAMRL